MDRREAIRELRSAIRYHRDQRGDARCWLDDPKLWALLPDTPPQPTTLPNFEAMMAKCRAFYAYRGTRTTALPQAPTPVADVDTDLDMLEAATLDNMLILLQEAVRTHRDIIGRERTFYDDATLYAVLPEKIAADFSLPSEEDFLGEGKAPHAGCPSFWRSHQECATEEHRLSTWGPCV